MLDSGAYSAFRQGKKIDIDEYGQFVLDHGHNFNTCITLDVIGNNDMFDETGADEKKAQATYDNWIYLRKKGANVIPVFHLGTSEKWLEKYLKETDHICLGAIANLSTDQRVLGLDDIWRKHLIDPKTKLPKVKVHGLGLTAIPIMLKYPWHSVDSMTPLLTAVFGRIYLPHLSQDNNWEGTYFNGMFCAVSDQSKRKKVWTDFAGLPTLIKERYEAMFDEHGFDLGEIFYVSKNETRRDKNEKKRIEALRKEGIYPMEDESEQALLDILLPQPKKSEGETLANSWWRRLDWNIHAWTELINRMPAYPRPMAEMEDVKEIYNPDREKTIVYFGVSTVTHLQRMTMAQPRPDILVSYAFMEDNFLNAIKTHKDE